jgi:hypothetical protein
VQELMGGPVKGDGFVTYWTKNGKSGAMVGARGRGS